MTVEAKYLEIIDPKEFIKNFKTENEFLKWLNTGTIEDIRCTLTKFQEAEMYEVCNIIKKVLWEIK